MNNIRHIHEVLEIIYGTDKKYSTSSLITELKQTFGEEVNFTSCSDNVFPLSGVVSFLLERNKIRLEEDVIIPLTPACSH
jgi:probable metal-binding protein